MTPTNRINCLHNSSEGDREMGYLPGESVLRKNLREIKKDYHYLLMILPGVIYFLIFCYVPMAGIVIAFQDYRIGLPLFANKWVGLKWFVEFFTAPNAYRLVRNTVLINIYNIIFMTFFTIFFALMLNEIRIGWYKRLVQTISYLPYFISVVIIVGLLANFLSLETGVVNIILTRLGFE